MKIRTAIHAVNYTTNGLQEALRPITSLIRKSEKAQQQLVPGSWQHTMLRDNLKALRIACALMNKEAGDTESFTRDDLQDALRAFASMTSKTEKAQARFSPGTSQHTLQQNRLKALRIAEALTKAELDSTRRQRPNHAMEHQPSADHMATDHRLRTSVL